MNLQILVSPPARVEPRHKDARLPGLHADKVALHPAITRVYITIDSGFAAKDQVIRPAATINSIAALEDAAWMVPDGDGWAEVYGDSDGLPVLDVEMRAPSQLWRWLGGAGRRWLVAL